MYDTVRLFKESAGKKQIEFNADIQKKLCVMADPYAVDRIINNLLDNALKYTEKKGKVDITLKADRKEVVLSIKDNGIGV